jgi:RNA polymerase sigma-70 factor (ECF subfamily)
MADVATFVEHRPLLFSIAYRMLGSTTDAEDIVSEAFLRWRDVDADTVQSPKSYLAAIVTRLCIDHLRSARVRREQYVGPWLPEPLLVAEDAAAPVEMADSLSTAFLVVLETLTPDERAAFLLREVFGHPYDELAQILDRSEASCRQLVHRARSHIAARRPRFDAEPEQQRAVTEAFLRACATGNLADLVALLTEDAVLLSDGGGVVKAAQRPIHGRDRAGRFLLGVLGKAPAELTAEIEHVNGAWGIVARVGGVPFAVITLDTAGGRIQGVHLLVNPQKLAALPPA